MSSFETIQDAAFALKAEGQEIKINFKKGVPTTGQATVEWTIPKPAQGCESSDTGAYAGIVILLGTEAMDGSNIPVDGTVYVADPTADTNLSVGDKIGGALVVGAVYECEQKARGETLTTSIVINDIDSHTGYYVAGYALDCQNRYHSDGIRSYSDVYSNKESGSISASQEVLLGVNQSGVLPTDGTGLVAGTNYEFDLIYDNSFPEGQDWKAIPITVDGLNAGTYQELMDEIRNDILLINNPTQSPVPPNAGGFYWNASDEQLFQFDGFTYAAIDSINEPTDPANPPNLSYWFNTLTNELSRWNFPTNTIWNPVEYITSEIDPMNPACDTIWYDPHATGSPSDAIVRTWNNTTWCDAITFTQATDPSDCPVMACNTHWFDETLSVLNVWDEDLSKWTATSAIVWPTRPDTLPDGTYWYDDVALTISLRTTGAWVDITTTTAIQETAPTTPTDGMLWYTPSTEVLQQYQSASPIGWTVLPVLVWEADPTIITSCDLWWDTTLDLLKTWDIVNSEWDTIVDFIQSPTDPSLAATIEVDSFWFNTSTSTLSQWDGSVWVVVTDYITKETDPTDPLNYNVGSAWLTPSTGTWNYWNGTIWSPILPEVIDSDVDPKNLPTGTYWFNTTAVSLQVWNGAAWQAVLFTTIPFTYTRGEQWYNTTTNELFEWNGTTWIEALPVVTLSWSSKGGWIFITRKAGSDTAVLIPTPEGSTASNTPCSIGTGYAFDGVTDIAAAECEYATAGNVVRVYPARAISDATFLWSNLTGALVVIPKGGNDGISGVPSYLEVGVGTDGTPDERRELMGSIRSQLGHPIVEVELDNVQLDTCVTLGLEEYRKRAGSAYRRGFFFLDIQPGTQQYLMTNKIIGYNRIVTVMSAYRFTSAFLSSAHGAGAYGQIVLQHLYNMGTYDLTSFFLVSQYVEQLEHLFATRLTFSFHENNRLLSFYTAFTRSERVLLDCMVERSEQDLLKDRFSKTWIERYALAEAMMMLSHIRGKFATLPGAGGGISLNAAELVTLAQSYREDCIMQIEEYVADQIEDVGMQGTMILG